MSAFDDLPTVTERYPNGTPYERQKRLETVLDELLQAAESLFSTVEHERGAGLTPEQSLAKWPNDWEAAAILGARALLETSGYVRAETAP